MKVHQFQYERENIFYSDKITAESTVDPSSHIGMSSGREAWMLVDTHTKEISVLADSAYILLENLGIGGAKIKLRKPFRLEYTYHNGLYDANNDEIRVSAISESLDGVIEIISEKIEILYDLYVNDVSMELTEDALELREKLKEYLGDSLCLR